jgi:phosphonate transport system substrate-binding protein
MRGSFARLLLASFFLAISGSSGLALGEHHAVYTLAVQPRFTPIETDRDWSPLLVRLEKDSGLSFQLRQYANQEAFEADLLKGIPDFVYLNPHLVVIAKRKQNYHPLLRVDQMLHGLIMVRNDSPLQKLGDLNGKTISFPAPTLFAPSLYMRYLLTEKEKLRFTPVFMSKPQNALRTALKGEVDAVSTSDLALQTEHAELTSRFRILYSTPGLLNFALAVHPRVPVSDHKKFQQALLNLGKETDGQKLLNAIQMAKLVAADYSRDYQALEKLRLERYALPQP